MKNVLLVDTNLSSMPIYKYLCQEGFNVYVIGGNPEDSLAKCVKNYINANYSNIDEVLSIINSYNIDYIIPGCNDLSYAICATISDKGFWVGTDSLSVTNNINNKDLFRKTASLLNIPSPMMIEKNDVKDNLPVIVKPIDAYSGRGVTVVEQYEDLEKAIEQANYFSKTNSSIIEQYVTGQLYSHSAFVENGSVIVDFIVEEHCTANQFTVDTSRVIYDFPQKTLLEIRDSIHKLCKHFKLVDGLVHTQFIKKDDNLWFIEVTRRSPGDLYSQLIELSTGINYAAMYCMPFIGKKLPSNISPVMNELIIRHTISQPIETNLEYIKFNTGLFIEEFVPMVKSGDLIKASPFSRVALIFIRSMSKIHHDNIYSMILRRCLYKIK